MLQESNDQLFNELRQANEKYLDVRIENNKLKDTINSLKLQIEQLKSKEQLNNAAQSRQRVLSSSGGGSYSTGGARKKAPVETQQANS